MQICMFGNYKLLVDLQDPSQIVKASSVVSAVGLRANNAGVKGFN